MKVVIEAESHMAHAAVANPWAGTRPCVLNPSHPPSKKAWQPRQTNGWPTIQRQRSKRKTVEIEWLGAPSGQLCSCPLVRNQKQGSASKAWLLQQLSLAQEACLAAPAQRWTNLWMQISDLSMQWYTQDLRAFNVYGLPLVASISTENNQSCDPEPGLATVMYC